MAYVLCPPNVLIGIQMLVKDKGEEVSRGELEDRVYSWYSTLDIRAWFAGTFTGLLSSFTLTENLIKT